jgi:hypothetical protein
MNSRKTALLFGAAMLYALSLSAQTEQGPTLMSQLNSDFYVGAQSGAHSYPTIQAAVTKTCALSTLGSRVIIPAGSPADGTSGYTISAVTGGCVKVSIEDRRAIPPGAYKWTTTGTPAYTLQTSGGSPPAGIPQDVMTNLNGILFGADSGNFTYTTSAHSLNTINQAMSGFFNQAATNLPVTHGVESDTSAPFDSTGRGSNTTSLITTNSWGLGKNVGNPGSFESGGQPGADAAGWRVSLGIDLEMNAGSSGIHQGMHLNPFVHGSGDSAAIYEGNSEGFSPCMWVDASGEGCVGLFINGTQYVCIATGTITSPPTTGNWSPVFNIDTGVNCNGANALINDGIIIDTDVTVLATNITGQNTQWSGPNGNFGTLPVTPGSATISTGIGVLTQAIPQSSAVDSNGARTGAYQTQAFAYTTNTGTITTGPVFVANDSTPEQCKIIAVGGSPTISCAKYHPIGAILFQNGAQGLVGFGDFDDDLTKTGLHDVVYVLGASDTSHLIIAERVAGLFIANVLPTRGVMAAGATLTGGFTVHPGALCVNTNPGNSQCTLEYNTAAWTAGHHFASPTGLPMTEVMGNFFSSQTAPDSPQSGGFGLSVLFEAGTQHSWLHPFIGLTNAASLTKYANSGIGTGWLSAPPAINVIGAMGNFAQFDMSLTYSGLANDNTPCQGATLFCNKNDSLIASTQVIKLYMDARGPEAILLDGPNSLFRFINWGITAPFAQFGGVSGSSFGWASNDFNSPDGTVVSQISNRYGSDPFISFSSCNTGTCAPGAYLSNASLSAGSFAAANLVAGSRPAQINFAFSFGSGSTNYCYVTTNVTPVGESAPSPQICVPQGTVTVHNLIVVQTKEGSQSVNVYRAVAVGPYAAGLICSGISNASVPQCDDSGQAAGALPPAVGNSGSFIVDGALQANSASINGSQALTAVQGTTGTKVLSCAGAFTVGHIIDIDTNGNCVDSMVALSTLPTLSGSNAWTGPNSFSLGLVAQGLVETSSASNATSSANFNPPNIQMAGRYWNGSASAIDNWYWTETLGTGTNPTSTFALNHLGSSGNLAVLFPMLATTVYTVASLPSASTLQPGTQVVISDASTFTPGTCTGGGSDYMIAVTSGTAWSCH